MTELGRPTVPASGPPSYSAAGTAASAAGWINSRARAGTDRTALRAGFSQSWRSHDQGAFPDGALGHRALCARAHFCAGRRNVAYRLDSTAEADERSGRLAQYLIVSLPALCLLSAAALSAIDPRKHGTWVVALCCVASLLRVHVLYRDESSEDWRAAVRYVSSQLRSGDELAFFPVFSKTSFAYYAKRTGLPMPNSGYRKTALGYVYHPTDSARRVWLFIQDSDTSRLARRLSLQRAELGGARVGSERAQFPDIRIELFERGGRPTAR